MKKLFLILFLCAAVLLLICGCRDTDHIHEFSTTEITKKATCTEAGERSGICRICNKTIKTPSALLAHKWDSSGRCSVCKTHKEDRGLVFTSNGDGTCSVKCDGTPSVERMEIPTRSPNGDLVTEIDALAFFRRDTLKEIVIPEGVTKIGAEAFAYCTELARVFLPQSVQHIEKEAFSNCTALQSILLPDQLITIGVIAFRDCTSLQAIRFPATLKAIGEHAFSGCKALAEISIPESGVLIGCAAFHGTAYYNDPLNWEEGVLYIGRYLYCTNVSDFPDPYTVKEGTLGIVSEAFFNRSVAQLHLPDSVRYIGARAFSECAELSAVTFPASLRSVGDEAFRGCILLEYVTFFEGLETIGDFAFENCKKLRTVHLPNSLETVGICAFADCTGVISMSLPKKPLDIGQNAFANTPYYNNEANWEGDVLYFDVHLLATKAVCTISKYTVKEETLSIAGGAFSDMSLDELTIPASVKCIADNAFGNCKIESLYLSDLAAWCRASFTVNPEKATKQVTNVYLNDKPLKDLVIPAEVTEIGICAFMGCQSLLSVRFHADVENVGKDAFRYCDNISELYLADIKQWLSADVEHIEAEESVYKQNNNGWELRKIALYVNDEPVTHLDIPDRWAVLSLNVFGIYFGIVKDVKSITVPQNIEFTHDMKYCEEWHEIIYYKGPRIVNGYGMSYINYYLHGTVYYYSETAPASEGLYWRYVNGVPTPWPTAEE